MGAMSRPADNSPPSADETRTRLILQARAGDRDAFEELMVMHEQLVYRTAWRLLGDREDARNASQEVFLRLHRFLHRYDPARPFEPWLYRLVVNACRDLQRRRPRLPLVPLDPPDPASPAPTAFTAPSQEAALAAAESRTLVAAALRQLSPKERAAVVLRDIEGLSANEVARILGSTAATVRSQASSARLKMRRFIERLRRRQP
jgi:RNA polymerase sigma-70 factor (ECF subfamily)